MRVTKKRKGNFRMGAITGSLESIIRTVLTIVQVVSIGGLIFAGFKMMSGKEEQRAEGRKHFMWVLVGCFVIFGASTIAQIFIGQLQF